MNPLHMNKSVITYTPINESTVDEQVPERSIFVIRVSSLLSSMARSLSSVLWHSKKVLARCKAGRCQPHALGIFLGSRIVTQIRACSSCIAQPVICSYSIRKQMKTHLGEKKTL